ncbi:MFS transporter [Bacillus sp. FJAT-42376]|uniref:MFS transporter n=1 Tax=Bacillus sp. FJAT-42376 TaxID=2014076 RepID=UPI000F50F2CE|nr:MFS transporter [Bacillus sp. FJAT-42376]AZB42420.1 MFS transporter [Bacillus sp. FJAT-42376]
MKKKAALLLTSTGISNLGDWIYFIPLNMMVYSMTGSAAAVAGLYMIRPLAGMMTSFWAGSLIDRYSQRNLMMGLDLIRAILVLLLLAAPSLPVIYALVFFICMADAFYDPAAAAYTVRLIPSQDRQVFNSYKSLAWSGSFILGPALAGLLFMTGRPEIAFFANALSFVLSALLLFRLPYLGSGEQTSQKRISLSVLAEDWRMVMGYMKSARYVMAVYLLFNGLMMMAAALDSQEVVFSREVLKLSDSAYGLLVSVSGVGLLIGSFVNRLAVKKLNPSLLIGCGGLMIAGGYLIYSLSSTFLWAAAGFFILAFFMAFANTGIWTFYQNHVPADIMGRVGSALGMVISLIQVIFIFGIGFSSDLFPLRSVIFAGAGFMMILSSLLFIAVLKPSIRPLGLITKNTKA